MMCSPSYVLVFNVSVRSYRPLGVAIHSKCVETYGNMASLSSLHLHPGIQPSWRWSSPSRYPKSNQTDLAGRFTSTHFQVDHWRIWRFWRKALGCPYPTDMRRLIISWLNPPFFVMCYIYHWIIRTPIPNKKPSPCGYLGTIPTPKGPTWAIWCHTPRAVASLRRCLENRGPLNFGHFMSHGECIIYTYVCVTVCMYISADPGRRKGERVREEDVLHCYYFGRNFDAFPSCRALLFERGKGAVSELGNSHPGAVFWTEGVARARAGAAAAGGKSS